LQLASLPNTNNASLNVTNVNLAPYFLSANTNTLLSATVTNAGITGISNGVAVANGIVTNFAGVTGGGGSTNILSVTGLGKTSSLTNATGTITLGTDGSLLTNIPAPGLRFTNAFGTAQGFAAGIPWQNNPSNAVLQSQINSGVATQTFYAPVWNNTVTNNGIIFNGTPLSNGSNTVSVGSATNQVSLKYEGQLPNTTNDLNGVSLDLNPTQATANQYIRNGISLYNASTSSMTNYVMFSFTYAKANATNINLGFYRSGYTGMVSNNFVSFNWTNRVQGGASMYSGIYTVSVNAASTWTNTTLVVPSFTNVPAGSTIQGWWYATPYSTNGASAVEYFTLESEAQIW